MAEKIKGITIEFRGNTTPLQKAIRTVNSEINSTTKELTQINKALKFNPGSVELWRQKQEVLTQKIKTTTDQLDALKQAQKQMDAAGVDKNSEEYRKLQREIVETESKLKTFENQLRSIGNVNLKALSAQLNEIGDKAISAGKDMSMKVTAPLVAIGGAAAKSFAEVDKTMQLTNATMGNSKEQADLLNKAMKDAAAQSTFGMTDAATATLNFARAGLTAEEAAAALAPAMNLAAGEGGDLDTVSAGLVATINGFHGSFDEAATYADVFANACNNSALDVDSLSNAMSVAAPIFASAGYSIKDASLYMGVMANNGIEADKAANSLKTGLARLVSPAKSGAEAMEALGISVTDTDGTMKSTVQIQKELHDAFAQLSESEQIAAASAIFGKNQMSPWLALINTAPADVAELNKQLEKEGTTTEMATAMMSGFGGSLEKLKSSADVAKTSLGEALAPAISLVADGLQKAVDWFNNLSPEMQSTIAIVLTLVAAIGPLLILLGSMAKGLSAIINFVNLTSGVLGGLGSVMSFLTSGPFLAVVAGILAIIAIIKIWKKHGEDIKQFFKNFGQTLKNIWNDIKTSFSNAYEGIKDAMIKPFRVAKDKIDSIIDKITGWFPIDIGSFFSSIKLPHLNVEWTELTALGKTIKFPSGFDVDWYDQGGIFDSPTIIGVGERRPEFVGALDDLRKIVREESGAGAAGVTINVYASPNMNINELTKKIEQKLVNWDRQRNMAYGNI